MPHLQLRHLFSLLVLGVVGCGPPAASSLAVLTLRVPHLGAHVDTGVDERGSLDLGPVAFGETGGGTFQVVNTGQGELIIDRFVWASDEAAADFTLSPSAGGRLGPGQAATFSVRYTAPLDTPSAQVARSSVVAVHARGTAQGRGAAQLEVKAQGVSGDCTRLPSSLDFGAVARGDTFTQTFFLTNTRNHDDQAFVGALPSGLDSPWRFAAGSASGEAVVPAQGQRSVDVTFAPLEARDAFATLPVRAGAGCPDVRVRLLGAGVDQVLRWAPVTVDLGFATPGTSVERDVTFENLGLRPVALSNLSVLEGAAPSTVFSLAAFGPTVAVPSATRQPDGTLRPGTAAVRLRFAPNALGPRQGTLRATTDLPTQGAVAVPLMGLGGGPDLEVAGALSFGRLAWFAGASSYATRNLTVRNVGTAAPVPLRLGAGGQGAAFWTVTAKSANTSPAELCVGLFDEASGTCTGTLPATLYEPSLGIVAEGAGASLDIPVRVTPAGLGLKEWEVSLFSNDPDEPEVRVTVTLEAIALPPCNVSVTPLRHSFGVLTPPTPEALVVQLRNDGVVAGDVCLVTNLELAPGTDPVFTLPAGPVTEKLLQPGEVLSVVVRAAPVGLSGLPINSVTALGQLRFGISNPTQLRGLVSLSATVARNCLTVTPRRTDFGGVAVGCRSETRAVELMNVCPDPIDWTGQRLINNSAAQPFSVQASPLPAGGRLTLTQGVAQQVLVAYQPQGSTADSAWLEFDIEQGAQGADAVLYRASLQGAPSPASEVTDTFVEAAAPKLDLLVLLDDSCSMMQQPTLRGNLDGLFSLLTTSGADFQVGVQTMSSGRLLELPGGQRFVTPTTPAAAAAFAAVTTLGNFPGANESCLWAARWALTGRTAMERPALIREGVPLAVLCLTDAGDYSQDPLAPYLRQFLAVKGEARPESFTFNVVGTATSPGCVVQYNEPRYTAVVQGTGGLQEPICRTDWAAGLTGLQHGLLSGDRTYFLRQTPDLSGTNVLEVRINGALVPATAGTDIVWAYDAAQNAVRLGSRFRPAPGYTLTVSYPVRCY